MPSQVEQASSLVYESISSSEYLGSMQRPEASQLLLKACNAQCAGD